MNVSEALDHFDEEFLTSSTVKMDKMASKTLIKAITQGEAFAGQEARQAISSAVK